MDPIIHSLTINSILQIQLFISIKAIYKYLRVFIFLVVFFAWMYLKSYQLWSKIFSFGIETTNDWVIFQKKKHLKSI